MPACACPKANRVRKPISMAKFQKNKLKVLDNGSYTTMRKQKSMIRTNDCAPKDCTNKHAG